MHEHHTLAGAYACDALDPGAASAFEHHLTVCQTCREETAEFLETAALLGACVAIPAPTRLRPQVASRIESETHTQIRYEQAKRMWAAVRNRAARLP